MTIAISPKKEISQGDVEVVAVDFGPWLDSGESLTGTPTVAEVGSSDLTLDNAAVSTGSLVINNKTVAAGNAIQFRVQGQQEGTTYTVKITASTDGTIARTKNFTVTLQCV